METEAKQARRLVTRLGAVIVAISLSGCYWAMTLGHSGDLPALKEIVSKAVYVGMPEADYLAFCKAHGWTPSYDRFQNKYVIRVPISKGDDGDRYSIMIDVWLTEHHEVKAYHLEESFTTL